jgi:hypothetical protein
MTISASWVGHARKSRDYWTSSEGRGCEHGQHFMTTITRELYLAVLTHYIDRIRDMITSNLCRAHRFEQHPLDNSSSYILIVKFRQ